MFQKKKREEGKRKKKRNMEVGSTIVKTFKRFTIPRSTSSIGSFTTSNGTATSAEQNLEDIPPHSKPHSSSHHKHPPLSYVHHFRSHHSQQNLTSLPSQQPQHLSTRPLSEDISSYMIRSASTNFTPKKSKVMRGNVIRTFFL